MTLVPAGEVLLEVENVTKTFGSQRALVDVALTVEAGEIRALVGPNGCGKSTLVKILAGYHQSDSGARITVAGTPLPTPHSPAEALASGLRFIHQDLALVPAVTVLENLALGRGYRTRFGRIDWRHERARARDALAPFGLSSRVDDAVATLTPGEQAVVAIARAFEDLDTARVSVLLLDEPTTALPIQEIDVLFAALRAAAQRGLAVVYISHRLDEIFSLATRVTVMRDARVVSTVSVSGLRRADLVELIVGRKATEETPAAATIADGDVVMRVRDVHGKRLSGVSLDVRCGEIVGATGLLGCGSDELARILFGAATPRSGTIEIGGVRQNSLRPSKAVELGIGLVPGDRLTEGSVPALSVRENVTLPSVLEFTRRGRVRVGKERRAVAQSLIAAGVDPRSPTASSGC